MKLSDYVFSRLKEWGARHVFLVTGGGAMHLNDSIGTSGLHYISTHHEQAAAMVAEGYARIAHAPGVLNVTTGPGGINALNGVFGAWTDSIPMLILSGQVKRETCMATLFDVQLDPAQEFEPRLRSKIAPDRKITTPNLEDMYPFLSPEELAENMLVKEEK